MIDVDMLVIGAGPSGAMTALAAARRGASVLLVEKRAFPREKPCGGCVSARAIAALRAEGLSDPRAACGARPIDRLDLAVPARATSMAIPAGAAVTRGALDAWLVEAAIARGVRFRDRCAAALEGVEPRARLVRLSGAQGDHLVRAGAVVVADGIGGRTLDGEARLRVRVTRRSHLGAGLVVRGLEHSDALGAITMACAAGGYIGTVRAQDDWTIVAAALRPEFVSASGGMSPAIESIRRAAGLSRLGIPPGAPWRGTPRLTRARARVAAERLFVVGDAAGYVEPFTGEGIAWALVAARAAAPIVVEAAAQPRWDEHFARAWSAVRRRTLALGHARCRLLARGLRHPKLLAAGVGVLAARPGLARPLVARLCGALP